MNLVAHPTEYKGVTFRSKSEAMMARALELANFGWSYEPGEHRIGSYLPDFCVACKYHKGAPEWLFEYKPSEPTDAYVESLRALKGRSLLLAVGWWNPFQGAMRWGGGLFMYPDREMTDAERKWMYAGMSQYFSRIEKQMEAARNFRFDLKSAV